MPGIDGYETCARLKADPVTADIPVVFLTALDHKEEEATGLDAGAVDYISKPIYPETVKARIRIHLALEEAQNEIRSLQARLSLQASVVDQLKQARKKLVLMVKTRNEKIMALEKALK